MRAPPSLRSATVPRCVPLYIYSSNQTRPEPMPHIQLITKPRLVALDSSHLGRVADDKFSSESSRRECAEHFESILIQKGYMLLLSWHHVYELLKHKDDQRTCKRAAFLSALPAIGWIKSFSEPNQIGSVLDILIAEIQTAWTLVNAKATEVRDVSAKSLVKFGSGSDIKLAIDLWHDMREEFFRREARDREVIALSRSLQFDISGTKVSSWLKQQLRSPEEAAHRLKSFQESLTQEIKLRGDKRIPDASLVANAFFDDIRNEYNFLQKDQINPGLQVLLRHGISIEDLDSDPTMGELTDLAMFRKQLEVANRTMGLPWNQLKTNISMTQLPSWIIQDALRKFGQDLRERKGSELSDSHLACLSAYADVTYVDKRTYENFRQSEKNSTAFAEIIRRVRKTSHYSDAIKDL